MQGQVRNIREILRAAEAHVGSEGYVYLVEAVGTNKIKIGITGNVPQRVRHLQVACPCPIELKLWLHGGKALERELHRYFDLDRERGEWFAISEDIKRFIDKGQVIRAQCEAAELASARLAMGNVIRGSEMIALATVAQGTGCGPRRLRSLFRSRDGLVPAEEFFAWRNREKRKKGYPERNWLELYQREYGAIA